MNSFISLTMSGTINMYPKCCLGCDDAIGGYDDEEPFKCLCVGGDKEQFGCVCVGCGDDGDADEDDDVNDGVVVIGFGDERLMREPRSVTTITRTLQHSHAPL